MLKLIKAKLPLGQAAVVLILLVLTPFAVAQPQVLRLLVWEGYAPEAQRLEFQRYIKGKYDVDLKLAVSYIDETEDCFQALRLKTADVLSPAHNRINDTRFRMFDLGLVLPVNLANIPNYQDLAERFQQLKHLNHHGQIYGVPFAWGPYGLIYNADKVAKPPTSWNALWEPRYRNQFTIADLGEHNVYITALALGHGEEDLKSFDALNNARFRNKLRQLVRNNHRLWLGVDTAKDLEGMALATSWGFSLPELKARGQNWKWAPLKEKSPGWIDNYILSHSLKDRPQLKRIAEEWINFAISPEFQARVLVEGLSARPVNRLTRGLLSAEQIENVGLAESERAAENHFVLMPELDRRTRNGFDLLWRQAKGIKKRMQQEAL
jgi:spermidine/putrescine transport system substrate-binding protein